MADTQTATRTRTTEELIADSPARELLADIFADLHPALIDEKRELASIFTAQSAKEFLSQLTNFDQLLDEDDNYDAAVKKLQGQIEKAEGVRDQLLSQVFERIRPIERSYRQLQLFFEKQQGHGWKGAQAGRGICAERRSDSYAGHLQHERCGYGELRPLAE